MWLSQKLIARLPAVSFIDWLDLGVTSRLASPKVSAGGKLDSGVRRLVAQAPAENDGTNNRPGRPNTAADGGVRIGGEDAAYEQRGRLNEPEPKHLLTLRARKTLARTRAEMCDYRGVGRALTAICGRARFGE